jgi:tetratricopeptide (TPR) repeat protein
MIKRSIKILAVGLGVGAALFVAGSLGVTRPDSTDGRPTLANAPVISGEPRIPTGGSLDALIASLQSRLNSVPNDHVSWATLGLAYVQQAKITVDSTYYPRADGALARSLEIDDTDNFLAYAGLSALASARHDFAGARRFAQRGLEINAFSAILNGALSDAELQLGNYDAALAAVQRMVDLSPDLASLSRASYTWELRGDIDEARRLMRRALADAPTAADRAFALVHIGDLSFDEGDANTALRHYLDALEASPTDVSALAGKAESEAALGQIETALDDYATVVARAPEPGYIVDYARLLESIGRADDADDQYAVFDATQRLFAANGVEADATATLFEVDRGNIDRALADAERGVATRPFVVMHDAQAWALHAAGRDHEALAAIDRAMALGTRSALFHFHAGMISLSLGDVDRAKNELTTALEINPAFDPLSADVARRTLESLEVSQ